MDTIEALSQRAQAAAAAGHLADAIAAATEAARRAVSRGDLWRSLGVLHYRAGQIAQALAAYRNALRFLPDDPMLFYDLGVLLKISGAFGEAEAMFREAMRRRPHLPVAAVALAGMLQHVGRAQESEQICRDALAVHPGAFDIMREVTNLYIQQKRIGEALATAFAFIEKNGQTIKALEQYAICLQVAERLDEAFDIIAAIIAKRPPQGLDNRLASYTSLSGRLARLEDRQRARDLIHAALPVSLPDNSPARWSRNDSAALRRFSFLFPYYAIEDRALMHAFRGIGDDMAARIPQLPAQPHVPSAPLRIGFVSANFSDHPIGHLLSPFFEAHGITKTDLFLYALHLNKKDPVGYADRIRATTPHYRDCRGLSARALAQHIRADNISILIDLDGYLGGGQPEAFAMRPAPVQIHWLQHLAGMPAPFIDYTIVDRVLVKDDERDHGNGPLIRLADAFQCGDRVALPKDMPKRANHGLPEKAIVFCAFGNWLKIDETIFAAWLDILESVPGSVLWLSDGPSEKSKDLFRDRLAARGLDRARLVFAAREPDKAQHLHRHRCADLFLDTFTFSAATTTTDALWAGLPVLTRPGTTGQSRLSESLMRAVGFTDTIVPDTQSYVSEAIRLAKKPKEIARLKKKLASLLPQSHLYDAPRMAAQFKTIYEKVWARHTSGAPPEHLDIEL